MNIENLVRQKEEMRDNQGYIQFSPDELNALSLTQVEKLVEHWHGHTMMRLPEEEIAFFEWLKKEDPDVWDDLWGDGEDSYMVSIDLLPQFLKEKNNFPICDLRETDNYYFTHEHIKNKGREEMPAIIEKTDKQTPLNLDELLLFELHIAPIDIWHFSYRYEAPLKTVKAMIDDMVYKGWIVHLTDREDLVRYIDV